MQKRGIPSATPTFLGRLTLGLRWYPALYIHLQVQFSPAVSFMYTGITKDWNTTAILLAEHVLNPLNLFLNNKKARNIWKGTDSRRTANVVATTFSSLNRYRHVKHSTGHSKGWSVNGLPTPRDAAWHTFRTDLPYSLSGMKLPSFLRPHNLSAFIILYIRFNGNSTEI